MHASPLAQPACMHICQCSTPHIQGPAQPRGASAWAAVWAWTSRSLAGTASVGPYARMLGIKLGMHVCCSWRAWLGSPALPIFAHAHLCHAPASHCREKVNNAVLFEKSVYEKLLAEVPKYKMITPSILSDRLRIGGSLARAAIKELHSKGLIRPLVKHAQQQIYTRATGA